MPQAIKKAVFPVAGLGTRFLPATKASPKEMLTVVDKPLIQYAVEEAIQAGIEQLIFVTGRNKRALEDHFDTAYELEAELAAKEKWALLKLVQSIKPDHVDCVYIRQAKALGLGHAVLCTRHLVGQEPFVVLLADDLLVNGQHQTNVTQQMIALYQTHNASIIGVEPIERAQSQSYGVIAGTPIAPNILTLTGIIEKPHPDAAPSQLGVVGRYILTPEIFDHLAHLGAGSGGEIQLTDGIAQLLQQQKVLAYQYQGMRYDCGSKLGYLKASVDLALDHPELGEEFAQFLRQKTQVTIKS